MDDPHQDLRDAIGAMSAEELAQLDDPTLRLIRKSCAAWSDASRELKDRADAAAEVRQAWWYCARLAGIPITTIAADSHADKGYVSRMVGHWCRRRDIPTPDDGWGVAKLRVKFRAYQKEAAS